jgi:hypothetical protein
VTATCEAVGLLFTEKAHAHQSFPPAEDIGCNISEGQAGNSFEMMPQHQVAMIDLQLLVTGHKAIEDF